MILLRKSIALVSLLAVLAPACSSGPDLIATIGDRQITTDDVAALYDESEIPAADVRRTVFEIVAIQVFETAAQTELGITVDETRVAGLFADMQADRDARNLTTADWLGVPGAGDALMELYARGAVIRNQVVTALATAPEYLDELFADPAAITEVCARHILVETEVEAQDAKVQLLAGADFAALADAISTDTGEGGDLGCRPASVYVPEFAAAAMEAPIGEVFGPVESQFGFHLLLVSERTTPTREDVIADPIEVLASTEIDTLWQQWAEVQMEAATVTVEPEYGTWSSFGILPPAE